MIANVHVCLYRSDCLLIHVFTDLCVFYIFKNCNDSHGLSKCVHMQLFECVYLPSGEVCRGQLTERMFLWTSSMGPGRWEILSLRSSASRARFSCSCLACREGSADVSVNDTVGQPIGKRPLWSYSKKLCGLHSVDTAMQHAIHLNVLSWSMKTGSWLSEDHW